MSGHEKRSFEEIQRSVIQAAVALNIATREAALGGFDVEIDMVDRDNPAGQPYTEVRVKMGDKQWPPP